MTDFFSANGVPFWFFIITCAVALIAGRGIRYWYLRKKQLKLVKEKEERKQEKKLMKREQRLRKKARNQKK